MSELDEEFRPLPYFPWEVRPTHIALDIEECATSLYLSKGVLRDAAARLRVDVLRLQRVINRSVRLQRLREELVAAHLNDRVYEEYLKAFEDEDSRRREWASAKVAGTEQFRRHPLAPSNQHSPTLSISQENNNITFVWRTEPLPVDSGAAVIENSFDEKDHTAGD